MKKLIIGLAGLVTVVFVVVIALGAGNVEMDEAEGCCAVKTECVMSATAPSACCSQAEAEKTTASATDCKESGCDHENCTGQCMETAAVTSCNPAMCSQHTAAKN